MIIIKIENSQNGMKTGTKIGIGIGVWWGVAVIVAVGLFLLKQRSIKVIDISEETIEIHEDSLSSTVHQNPLNSLMNFDDPFDDDFNEF